MLNLRQIDNKFVLSGGWTDVPKDAQWLAKNNFKAVLDLQFTPDNFTPKLYKFVEDSLREVNIEYYPLPMVDGDSPNLDRIFTLATTQLELWDQRYVGRFEKILVKCGVGVSRSVSCLIHYYCSRDRISYSEAKERITRVDKTAYAGLPISVHPELERRLKTLFPAESAFGGTDG